jgi:hypothetical protein
MELNGRSSRRCCAAMAPALAVPGPAVPTPHHGRRPVTAAATRQHPWSPLYADRSDLYCPKTCRTVFGAPQPLWTLHPPRPDRVFWHVADSRLRCRSRPPPPMSGHWRCGEDLRLSYSTKPRKMPPSSTAFANCSQSMFEILRLFSTPHNSGATQRNGDLPLLPRSTPRVG